MIRIGTNLGALLGAYLVVLAPDLLFFACGVVLGQASTQPMRRPLPPVLVDKTLVAWVYPANTSQRGGSVLTLQEGEAFDAIVFGERVPGKWMAGSDFFRRTQSEPEQGLNVTETADPKTLVQVAIVYKGTQIILYRNGQRYAAYGISKEQSFGEGTQVLIGLRYLGSGGAIGPFAGSVEEARLYDVALEESAIAALAPGKASNPSPVGHWTFEDGTANDATGNFLPGRLCGSARIAGGKLQLNGRDAYVAAIRPNLQAMFYKARNLGNQWDTWLYWHEGTYYLFTLAHSGPGGHWYGIALATSRDGVRWQEIGQVLSKAEGVAWLGTGHTWKSPDYAADKKFFLNFSEWRGPRQTIFFAESTDLLNWKRLGNEFEFVQDERWYERNGRWDCIYALPRPGGGLFGYWTATPKPHTRGRFGFGQTHDGVKWEALPPPQVVGAGEGEAGAVEKIGTRYFMMFGMGGKMVTLAADQPQGPFRAGNKNFVLLSGHTYFARFLPLKEGILVNHHAMARDGRVWFAPLKQAVVDEEGTLRLKWWKGNDLLKTRRINLPVPQASPPPVALLVPSFNARAGVVLEGTLDLEAAKEGKFLGLYLEYKPGEGTGILVGPNGVTQIGTFRPDRRAFQAEDRVDRQRAFPTACPFRLLLKHSLVEFYLDEHLIQCHSLPRLPTGRIGLIQAAGAQAIRNLQAWYAE